MAGTNPAFDEAAFRSGIRSAMQMGAPVKATEQATFVIPSTGVAYFKNGVQLASAPRLDQDGRPLDPEVEVRKAPDARLKVDCAYEFSGAEQNELPVGNFRPTKLTVTLFDVDRELVKAAKHVEVGGDRYLISYWPPPYGLFSVTIYTVVAFALDET